MANPPDAGDYHAKLRRLEGLIQQAEQLTDPVAKAHVGDIVRALLDLHGAGLGRLLDHLAAAGAAGGAVLDACAADEVVGGLLLLHGLHPLGVADRVRQALEQVRSAVRPVGEVELLVVDDGVAQLRLVRGDGGAAPAAELRQAIEEAIFARAPEVVAVDIEGLAVPDESTRFALPVL